MQNMLAMWGPAAKPGDQARISEVLVKRDRIHFEINGGPVKKQKWYQHIQVGGSAGMTSAGTTPMPIRAAPTWIWFSTAMCPS